MRYDVAISFLHKDAHRATQLADKLSCLVRGEIFVSPRRQDVLTGPDGDIKLTRIFRDDSRVVVVLYRSEWGKTQWTAVEERAIRDRLIRDKSTGFLVLANLEPPKAPDWFPIADQWFGLQEHGLEGLRSIISVKVHDAGGTVAPETPVERARRLVDVEAKRESLANLQRREGHARFAAAIEVLGQKLGALVDAVGKEVVAAAVDFEADREQFVLNCGWAALHVDGKQPSVMSLEDPRTLVVRFVEGPLRLRGIRSTQPTQIRSSSFTLVPKEEDVWLWHGRRGNHLTTDQLANELVNDLLKLGIEPKPRVRESRPQVRSGWMSDWQF